MYLSIGLLGGVAIGRFELWGHLPTIVFITFGVVSIVAILVALRRSRYWSVVVLILAGVILGVWRGSSYSQLLDEFHIFSNQMVAVTGLVTDDEIHDKSHRPVLKLSKIKIYDRLIAKGRGVLWVTLGQDTDVKRGEEVKIYGKFGDGFGTYIGSMYSAKLEKVTEFEPGDVARKVRDNFAEKVRAAMSEPAASLGLGFLVGEQSSLPSDLLDSLRVAGLTHIIVASGYNLTILVTLARKLFYKTSKFLAMFASGLMMVAMMAITGLSPSMTRAGLVTSLSLAAWYYGRRFNPLVLLSLSAAATVLYEPSYVWGDVGWLLSFTSFFGVLMVAPWFQKFFFGDKEPGVLRQVLGESVSAYIMTLPISMIFFGQISLVAIFANMMIVPFVPLAMLLTFIAGIGGYLSPILAPIIGWPAESLIDLMIAVANWWSSLPWAQL